MSLIKLCNVYEKIIDHATNMIINGCYEYVDNIIS